MQCETGAELVLDRYDGKHGCRWFPGNNMWADFCPVSLPASGSATVHPRLSRTMPRRPAWHWRIGFLVQAPPASSRTDVTFVVN